MGACANNGAIVAVEPGMTDRPFAVCLTPKTTNNIIFGGTTF